jgi:hypothetical protein
MSGRRLSVLAFLITLLIFAGMARGQGRYELSEQGQPPLQRDLANPEQPGLDGPRPIADSGSQTKNQKAPRPAGIKKQVKGITKPDFFRPASGPDGVQQARGTQTGASSSGLLGLENHQLSSPGSTSFLDGYLQRSLHEDGLARKKPAAENKPKDDLLLQGRTSSKF